MAECRILRIALVVALQAGLAACSAVDKVQQDMTRDWRSFESDVLNKTANGAPAPQGTVAGRTAAPNDSAWRTPPQPPPERPAVEASQSELASPDVAALRAKAAAGDAEAEYQLGLIYDEGRKVDRDPAQALRWYRTAAEHGHVLAALNTGVLYDSGSGVPRDAVAAAFWYRKAADADNGRAAYNLGLLYENGDGVPRDQKQALVWHQKAQRAGIAAAGAKVAALSPKPAPARIEQSALPALDQPADAPDGKRDERLRMALAKDYAPGASAEDDQAVAALIRAAADGGDAQAACNLGMRYVNGRGVARDWAQGESWLRRAAQRGHVPAQNNLGMLLASEQYPNADSGEALMWVSKAANAGYGPARAQLGMMYANGRGVPQDRRMADFWLASARQDMRAPAGSCEPLSAPQRAAIR